MKELNAAEIQDVNGGSIIGAFFLGMMIGYVFLP